jgi:hypothetical protein
MKLPKIIRNLLILALFAPCVSFGDETNTNLDAVIRAIHADILQLSGKYSSLSNYSDKFLGSANDRMRLQMPTNSLMIFYVFPNDYGITNGGLERQIPEQFTICYCDINQTNVYSRGIPSDFEDVAVCHFPSLGLKIYGHIFVDDDKLRELIIQIVEKRCAEFHTKSG